VYPGAEVIGVPDMQWGERREAFVVLKPGSDAGEQELVDHCRPRLARRSERDARRALAALRALLAELGLRPKQAKTRIVCLREGGEGFDFFGFPITATCAAAPRARVTSPSSLAGPHARRCSTPAIGSMS
jgi:AMP-binding enzyme C-terminal domain